MTNRAAKKRAGMVFPMRCHRGIITTSYYRRSPPRGELPPSTPMYRLILFYAVQLCGEVAGKDIAASSFPFFYILSFWPRIIPTSRVAAHIIATMHTLYSKFQGRRAHAHPVRSNGFGFPAGASTGQIHPIFFAAWLTHSPLEKFKSLLGNVVVIM